MNSLIIDTQKCTRDELCVAVCPMNVIRMNGQGPEWIERGEQYCINCGHCVAVCPHGALSLPSMSADQCLSLSSEWRLSPPQMEQLLKGRRSIRKFTPQPVKREILSRVFDMASFAPSGKNAQQAQWLVITDAEEVTRLAELTIKWMRSLVAERSLLARALGMKGLISAWDAGDDQILRNAPHLILAHAPQKNPSALQMCTIALTYVELSAIPFGLGTCWSGYFQFAVAQSSAVQEALMLPEGQQCFGSMMVGYPQLEYQRIPRRNTPQVTWR